MAGKDALTPIVLFTNADMSQASISSASTFVRFFDNIAISLVFTGSPVGTFTVYMSVDNVNFVPLPVANGTTTPFANGADDIIIDLNQMAPGWVKVIYAKTSGTGVLNGMISAKMV